MVDGQTITRAVKSRRLMRYAPDAPLRLRVAAEVAFPDGTMTARGLRREARRGHLVIERIAGKDYTTLSAINEMRLLCRVEGRGPVSGSAQVGETKLARSLGAKVGSSSTAANISPQDALRAKLNALSRF
jgi:hypothetical protein